MTLDERIEQLMRPGCDYDPFRPDNLAEALANLEHKQVVAIAGYLRHARSSHLNKGLAHTMVGQAVDIFAGELWKKLATTQAQAGIDREQDEACPACGGNEGKGCTACDVKLRREQRCEE